MKKKKINGFKHHYITDTGIVMAKARTIIAMKDGVPIKKLMNARILKPTEEAGGYKHVVVSEGGVGKCYKLHRLVAEHFLPDWDPLLTVDHINRK